MPNSAALNLTAGSSYGEASLTTALTITGDLTLEAWINASTFGGAYVVVAQKEAGGTSSYFFRINFGYLEFLEYAGFGNQTAQFNMGGSSDNTWYHVAVTRTGRTIRGYVNGVEVGTPVVFTGSAPTGSETIRVGASAYSSAITGIYDEVRIWNVARTGTQIADYKDTQASGSETGLVACWHFNEGTGTSAADATTGGHTLTLSGTTWNTSSYPTLTDAGGGGSPQSVTPNLLTNTSTLYSPTVTPGAVTVAPALLTNAQTFHAPTLTTGAVTVAPNLHTNSSTIYSPVVTQDGGPQFVAPALLTNAQTFPAATVTPGAVSVQPALLTNTSTFYAPTVTSAATVAANLLTNTSTLYSPTVTLGTPGAQSITPSLLTNAQVFYSPTVSGGAEYEPPYTLLHGEIRRVVLLSGEIRRGPIVLAGEVGIFRTGTLPSIPEGAVFLVEDGEYLTEDTLYIYEGA
jgi:hypothetical protein